MDKFHFTSFLIAIICWTPNGQAQHCYSDHLHKSNKETQKEYRKEDMRIERWMYRENSLGHQHRKSNQDLTIPVVFHVVAPDTSANNDRLITSSELEGTLDLINQGLSGQAICPGDPAGSEGSIQLCLAQRTLFNEPSSGIHYWQNEEVADVDPCTENMLLKNIARQESDPFPSTDYLNVWVVDEICPSCYGSCALSAYATFPAAHGSAQDGIVIEARQLQPDQCDKLKIFMHEIGHYLNLYHTFDGGCKNDDCLLDGDRVCDTPPDNDDNFYPDHPCLNGQEQNSCNTDVNPADPNNPFTANQADPSNNFMDYSPQQCQNSFTEGQIERIERALTGPRESLLQSQGCQQACLKPITIRLDYPDSVAVGELFTVINNSENALNYEWRVDGQVYNTIDFQTSFSQPGIYDVSLIALNEHPECQSNYQFSITVYCDILGEMQLNQTEFLAGDQIELNTNASDLGSIDIRWTVDSQLVSEDSRFSFAAKAVDYYHIELELCNAICCKKLSYYLFNADDCVERKPLQYWYFADDNVMDFTQSPPVITQQNLSEEGRFVNISMEGDKDGNVLMYSETHNVYNRDNDYMLNGENIRPAGFTTNEESIIAPEPGRPNIFHVLIPPLVDGFSPTGTAMESVSVDINLDSGKGGVENIRHTVVPDLTEELVALARHCNGQDWWVISKLFQKDSLVVVLWDETGFHTPQFYATGFVELNIVTQPSGISVNPQGNKLAYCVGGQFQSSTNYIALYQFDNSTGEISNGFSLNDLSESYRSFWRVEFSPDGKQLYTPSPGSVLSNRYLSQYDLSVFDSATIVESKLFIPLDYVRFTDFKPRDFSLGPDRKIYIMGCCNINGVESQLAVIHNPNQRGVTCNVEQGIDTFLNYTENSKFPSFPNDYYVKPPVSIMQDGRYLSDTDTVCLNEEGSFEVDHKCLLDFQWQLPGSTELLDSTEQFIAIRWTQVGEYPLVFNHYRRCDTLSDTVMVVVQPCNTECTPELQIEQTDSIICSGEQAFIEWSSNADSATLDGQSLTLGQVIAVSPTFDRCYELQLFSKEKCDTAYQFCVQVQPALDLEDNIDRALCTGEEWTLNITTDADRLDLINQASDHVLPDLQPGALVNTPESDSCYTLRLQREDGCDTYYDFCVDVYPVYADTSSYQYCDGDEAFFEGMRIRSDTFVCANFTSSFFCDSVVCADFIFSDEEVVSEEVSLCTGDTLVLLGQAITEAGSYQQRYERTGDCDSLQIFEVVEEAPPLRNLEIELCQGETIELYSENLSEEGQYLFEAAHGGACDSLIGVQLWFADTFYQNIEFELCDGDSIWVVDAWENSPGWYTHRLSTSKGCDSVIETRLRSVEDISGPELSVLCEELLIEARQAVPENWSIAWSNGDTLRQTTYTQGGTDEQVLLIRQQDSTRSSCIREIAFSLPVLPQEEDLQAFLQDTQANQGELIQLSIPLDPESWDIAWSSSDDVQFDCITCFSVELRMSNTSQISYVLTHQATGCEYAYHFQLELVDQKDLFLPSAFSPNDDGNNDQWEAFLQPYVSNILECRIYNRWGGQVAAWENVKSIEWDGTQNGKPLNPGVYVYFLRYQLANGEEKVVQGDVTLAR